MGNYTKREILPKRLLKLAGPGKGGGRLQMKTRRK